MTNGAGAPTAADDDGLDDDAPLDEAEAADAAALAGADTDEIARRAGGHGARGARRRDARPARATSTGWRSAGACSPCWAPTCSRSGSTPAIAKAALSTPDTRPSPRGAGWIAFTPATTDRFALDRAEAWVRLAYRRAGGAG